MQRRTESTIIRLIIFLAAEFFIDQEIFGRFVSLFRLSDLVSIAFFKLLTLVTIIFLVKFVLRQPVGFKRPTTKGGWIFWVIWGLACLGLTVLLPQHFFAAVIVGLCGAVPEELMYRAGVFGVIYNTVNGPERKKPRLWVPLLLSSLLFAASHLVNLQTQTAFGTMLQIVQAFGMGVPFSAVYIRMQNILYPMAVHFFINFMVTSINGYPVPAVTAKAHPSITPTIVALVIYLSVAAIVLFRAHRPSQLGTETWR
jgi:membrane protease YdiL (CAAX protease family)